METPVRWAGNPDITLVIKLLSLRITVQVGIRLGDNKRVTIFFPLFISFGTLICFLTVGRFTNIFDCADCSETSCAVLSMLLEHRGVSDGKSKCIFYTL